jgi:hypothetical protein
MNRASVIQIVIAVILVVAATVLLLVFYRAKTTTQKPATTPPGSGLQSPTLPNSVTGPTNPASSASP